MAGARGCHLHVRLSDSERRSLERRSRLAGTTVSDYVRSRALAGEAAPPPSFDAAALKAAHADLKRAGNNLNQVARALNSRGPSSLPPELVAGALASVAAAASCVAGTLASGRRGGS